MRYKHFRKANVDVSAVTTGTWPLGCFGYGEANEKDGIEAIHAMVANGVNCLDTAPDYGPMTSEIIVGKALKGLDRSKILVSTKGGAARTTLRATKLASFVPRLITTISGLNFFSSQISISIPKRN